jgi:hypothetical protein
MYGVFPSLPNMLAGCYLLLMRGDERPAVITVLPAPTLHPNVQRVVTSEQALVGSLGSAVGIHVMLDG